VIAVLLAAATVATSRLQMSSRVGADPDVGPCGGYGERVDAPQVSSPTYLSSGCLTDIPERRSPPALYPGLVVRDVEE
jgi:hypothetical protein